ncbi:MAG: regulatory protein RecX [Lachnospiraceae bacterium]|nr:regulatory protein RecX [Lachnospiraceae bacterium]
MILVKTITPVTNKKSKVELEGQPAFVLYKGELSRYGIREEQEISEECYREIIDEVLTKRAKIRTMHLLMTQDRTEAELRGKLTRDGHPDEVIDRAIAYVKSYHYIDDARYTRQYLESRRGKKSLRSIQFELERRGVDRDTILAVWEESGAREQSETGQIEALLRKRAGEPHRMDEKELRRIYGYLARRGYSGSDISSVLARYQQ